MDFRSCPNSKKKIKRTFVRVGDGVAIRRLRVLAVRSVARSDKGDDDPHTPRLVALWRSARELLELLPRHAPDVERHREKAMLWHRQEGSVNVHPHHTGT